MTAPARFGNKPRNKDLKTDKVEPAKADSTTSKTEVASDGSAEGAAQTLRASIKAKAAKTKSLSKKGFLVRMDEDLLDQVDKMRGKASRSLVIIELCKFYVSSNS